MGGVADGVRSALNPEELVWSYAKHTEVHFAIRQLMAQAAWNDGLDPDRLSFVHAVRVIKRKMSSYNVRHRGAVLHQVHEPRPVVNN